MVVVAALYAAIGIYEMVSLYKEGKKKQVVIYSILLCLGIGLSIAVAMGVKIYYWHEWFNEIFSDYFK